MKFLVINTFKRPTSEVPQAALKKMWDDTLKLVEQYRKAGTILRLFFVPGWNKVMTIEDHKSAETPLQNLSGHPMADFMDFEVYPVVDNFDEMLKVMAKMFNVNLGKSK